MVLFIFMLLSLNSAFLWILLIGGKKAKSEEEKFIEDNLQMQYLKEYSLEKK